MVFVFSSETVLNVLKSSYRLRRCDIFSCYYITQIAD
mgnify:CR=1 FL=1